MKVTATEEMADILVLEHLHLVGFEQRGIAFGDISEGYNGLDDELRFVLFPAYIDREDAQKSIELFRRLLVGMVLLGIDRSRKILPANSPVTGSRIETIRHMMVEIRGESDQLFRYSSKGVWEAMRDLLLHIEHLESLVAFLMNEPEGENARALLELARAQGRREGDENGR